MLQLFYMFEQCVLDAQAHAYRSNGYKTVSNGYNTNYKQIGHVLKALSDITMWAMGDV